MAIRAQAARYANARRGGRAAAGELARRDSFRFLGSGTGRRGGTGLGKIFRSRTFSGRAPYQPIAPMR